MIQAKKNILFISSHLPSANVPQAAQYTALATLKEYSNEYNVFLVSFYNDFEKKYLNKNIYVFCQEAYFYYISLARKFAAIITNIDSPLSSRVRVHRDAENMIAMLQDRIRFDVVHFEFTSSAYYLKLFANTQVRTVIMEHDVCYQRIGREHNVAKGLKRYLYGIEYRRQKKWELKTLKSIDSIIVPSYKDKNLLVSDGIEQEKIVIKKPPISELFKQIKRDHIENSSLLFWGAMNRNENVNAIEWFLKEMFPRISAYFPDVRLYIVGANPPHEILKLQSKCIIVTGFVDNPVPYFEKCHVAIAPLRLGAGIKKKVLEYLEAGLPVVATSVGAEGIDNNPLLYVTDDSIEFTDIIIKLLSL